MKIESGGGRTIVAVRRDQLNCRAAFAPVWAQVVRKQALLLESLRVLKKGGVFVLHDNMKPRMYGDMQAFAEKLRGRGFAAVRYVDITRMSFGSKQRAAMMMLGRSAMVVGRK